MSSHNISKKGSFLLLVFICSGFLNSQTIVDTTTASVLYKKGDSLLYYRNFKESTASFEEARKIYEQTQNWERIVSCHNKLSKNYRSTLNLEKALFHAEQALQISEANIPDNVKANANALDNLGLYYKVRKSDFDTALEYFNKAFQLRTKNLKNGDPDFALSHYNLGAVKTYKGQFKEALAHFDQAIAIRQKTGEGESIEVAEIYRQIGNTFYEQALYDDALAYLEKASVIANKTYKSDNYYFVDLYNNIGLMYDFTNQPNRSLEYYTKSLHLSELHMGSDHADQVSMHYNIARIYQAKKNKEKALFHVDKTIKIGVQAFGEEFPNLALPYSLKGLLLKGEEGIVYVKKALDLSSQSFGENNVRTAYFYAYLGELYGGIDQFDFAFKNAQKALDIRIKVFGEHNFYVAESYNLLATLEIKKKNYGKALGYLEKAIKANERAKSRLANHEEFDIFLSPTRLLTSLERKGFVLKKIYEKGKDSKVLEESISTYQKASRLVETIRRTQFNKEDKITFAKDAKNVFYGGIATQLFFDTNKKGVIEKAFEYAESSKASLLKELLNDSNAKVFSGLPAEILKLEQHLRRDLSQAKSLLYNNLVEEDVDKIKISDLESKIADISRRQDSLKKVLEKKYPRYYQLKYENTTLSIKEIQKRLQENTTLLEYFTAENKVYVFVLTKNTATVKELPISGIDQKMETFRSSILFKNEEEYKRQAYQLYRQLIAPVKDQITGTHLIIVPDESLWYLNFDLLLTLDSKTEDQVELPYLIKDFAVSYANSASLLFKEPDTKTKTSSNVRRECLAFSFSNEDSLSIGDQMELELLRDAQEDLPGTREEIKRIAEIVKGRYFFGSQAIEQNFKKNLSNYNVLHLALHGEVDDQNPENSKIYFTKAGDSIEDNILYSHELYALNIPAELTVLSACNTGMGKIAKGEGILSLGTAFQYAGTKSLLLTGWEVSDKTTPGIMQNFYSNLNKGMNKAEALQQAKLAYLETTDVFTKDPFYWGGFYLVGDYSSIEFEKSANTSWSLYLLIVLIGLGVFLYLRRKSIR